MDWDEEEKIISWVERLNWDELASLVLSVKLDLEAEGKDAEVLAKQLGILKRVLAAKLKQAKNKKVIEVSFLLGLIRSIEKMEQRLNKMSRNRGDMLLFLKAVVTKLEKEGKLMMEKIDEKKTKLDL